MDKKAIENLSVDAVESSLSLSEYLEPIIDKNDKTPSLDGFVNIYNAPGKRKSTLIGQVAVQIKGHICEDFSKEEISFIMSVSDLKNYLHKGIILFVVYITADGTEEKIYYNAMTPVKLQGILASSKDQKDKTVKLREFPEDNNRKFEIFVNCCEDSQKQSSFADAELYTLDKLQTMGEFTGLKMSVSMIGNQNVRDALFNNEIYLYAEVKGSSIPQPLPYAPYEIIAEKTVEAKIKLGDQIFYDWYTIRENKSSITIKIGDSVELLFPKEHDIEGKVTMKYKESSFLRKVVKDLDFLISFIDNRGLCIEGIDLSGLNQNFDFSDFNIKEAKERLSYLNNIIRALEILGYKGDINLKKLNSEDYNNLDRLVVAFVEGKPVKNLKKDLPLLNKIKIQDAQFALILRPCEESGTYEFLDFFSTDLPVVFKDENGELVPASQYMILSAKDLLELSNLRTSVLLPSFEKLERTEMTLGYANYFFLELIKAYDLSNDTRDDLLEVAFSFSEWFQSIGDTKLDKQINQLNYLQLIKRKRELNDSEKEKLYSIVEDNDSIESNIVGAYLLLDLQKLAERHFQKMKEEEQNQFKELPIYHFWCDSNTEDDSTC